MGEPLQPEVGDPRPGAVHPRPAGAEATCRFHGYSRLWEAGTLLNPLQDVPLRPSGACVVREVAGCMGTRSAERGAQPPLWSD